MVAAWRTARQQKEQRRTQSEQIGSQVQRLFALGLLGSHVVERAEESPQRGLETLGRQEGQLRQAEVQQFHASVPINHHVRRLDVAMDRARLMRDGKRVGHLPAGFARFANCQRSVLPDHPRQVDAVDQLHHEIGHPVNPVGVGRHHNARMVQAAENSNLALEPASRFGSRHHPRTEHFQCDLPVQLPVPRPIDDPHAPAAQNAQQLVSREPRRQPGCDSQVGIASRRSTVGRFLAHEEDRCATGPTTPAGPSLLPAIRRPPKGDGASGYPPSNRISPATFHTERSRTDADRFPRLLRHRDRPRRSDTRFGRKDTRLSCFVLRCHATAKIDVAKRFNARV